MDWCGLVELVFKVSIVWNGGLWNGGRNDVADPVPAALQPVGAERQAVDFDGAADDRHPAEGLGEQPSHRVHFVVVELQIEEFAEVIDAHPGADPVAAVTEGHGFRAFGVVLVDDLAHDFLDEILQGDQPGGPAVFIDDNRDVRGFLLQLAEQFTDRF